MSPLNHLKTKLIDRIIGTENERLLKEIDAMFPLESNDELYSLDSYQLEILEMSKRDIHSGNIVTESELANSDKKWMK